VICGQVFSLPKNDIATASTMLLAVVGFIILFKISEPFNRIKYGILIFNIFGLVFCGIFLNQLFAISEMSKICVLLLIVFSFAAESLFRYLTILIEKLDELYSRIKHRKK
jgi:cation-transporting ATPase E